MTARPEADGRVGEWQPVCRIVELEVDRGVTALVHGNAIALFKTDEQTVYALGNHDPFARAPTSSGGLARGIVGRRGGVPIVGSPAHRHAFDLRTGRCLEDRHVVVASYEVKVVDGVVHVGQRKGRAA